MYISIVHRIPPMTPQLIATSTAILTSLLKTWLSLCAAKWPVASPETTMAEVCSPAFPLMAAIMGTNATAARYMMGLWFLKKTITSAVIHVPMRHGRSHVILTLAACTTETSSSSFGLVPAIAYRSSAASSSATSMIRSAVIRPMS